jgi:hypothetical protein
MDTKTRLWSRVTTFGSATNQIQLETFQILAVSRETDKKYMLRFDAEVQNVTFT